MRVVVYAALDASDIHEPLTFVAHLVVGKDMLPMRFNGATVEAARAAAETWIAEEQAKVVRGIAARAKAAEALAAYRETKRLAAVPA
jgi:hypothetical protein